MAFSILFQIYVSTNPRGAELLPPGIVVSETDLYLRRLWGDPSEVRYIIMFKIEGCHNLSIRMFLFGKLVIISTDLVYNMLSLT